MKRIELRSGTFRVEAVLLEDKAPKATMHLWNALPLNGPLRHARWSGNAAYFTAPALAHEPFDVENQVSFCLPGTLCLLHDDNEILLSYGQSQARNWSGNVWATEIGQIEGDRDAFFRVLAATQTKGAGALELRRLED